MQVRSIILFGTIAIVQGAIAISSLATTNGSMGLPSNTTIKTVTAGVSFILFSLPLPGASVFANLTEADVYGTKKKCRMESGGPGKCHWPVEIFRYSAPCASGNPVSARN
ncbi:hypothetical protein F4779DRAFT_106910 [Xylariaceae sp. FL0662B]|nr:hypothetical protein F4779DRAFT_106910 [Xylariaceae sp. FL0662B]